MSYPSVELANPLLPNIVDTMPNDIVASIAVAPTAEMLNWLPAPANVSTGLEYRGDVTLKGKRALAAGLAAATIGLSAAGCSSSGVSEFPKDTFSGQQVPLSQEANNILIAADKLQARSNTGEPLSNSVPTPSGVNFLEVEVNGGDFVFSVPTDETSVSGANPDGIVSASIEYESDNISDPEIKVDIDYNEVQAGNTTQYEYYVGSDSTTDNHAAGDAAAIASLTDAAAEKMIADAEAGIAY